MPQPPNTPHLRSFPWLLLSLLLWGAWSVTPAWPGGPARSQRAMVATVHPLATQAAVQILNEGGNAIDAAVTAGLTLGVVDTANSGIGGGCLMLIRRSNGQLLALDGRETAPARASRDMFVVNGRAQRQQSLVGPLASGIPGALAAYAAAVEKCGQLELQQLLQPAAELAEKGFPIDQPFAARLARRADELRPFAGTRAVLFTAADRPYRAGEWLKQPDLANSYRQIAEHGIEWFYQGAFAQRVADWMHTHDGLITRDDFAAYQVRWREPIVSSYRKYQIIGFPPPSSGGIHVAQILNIVEQYDLKSLYAEDRATFTHLVAAAMKRAFADRAHWLGDSDFAAVPRGLLDKRYAASLAASIDRQQTTAVPQHGLPPGWQDDCFGKHTTHVAVADAAGNWVALTQTINTSFGSGVIVPGTGVVLNNQMDDFSIQPGVPNTFGLVGGEANAIAPGKRPLSSMSPTLVLQDGRPILTVGAAGGPTIISQVVLALIRHLDLELSLEQAVTRPRFHHQWRPNRLMVEQTFAKDLIQQLEKRGHDVTTRTSIGVTQAICQPDAHGTLIGIHDPRIPGQAAGPKTVSRQPKR